MIWANKAQRKHFKGQLMQWNKKIELDWKVVVVKVKASIMT